MQRSPIPLGGGSSLDNFRAGERMKFKLLCQSANELNSGFSDGKTNS